MSPRSHEKKDDEAKVAAFATILLPDGCAVESEIIDLCKHGMFVHSSTPLAAGSQCQATIRLGHIHHELSVSAACTVVHVAGHNIAFRFESINLEGLDKLQGESIEHIEGLDLERLEFSHHGGWVFTP